MVNTGFDNGQYISNHGFNDGDNNGEYWFANGIIILLAIQN